jgi:tetratricopeptide (TPR) repeat protein
VVAAAVGCLAATLAAQAPADLSALITQAQASIRQGRDTEARRLIADVESRINKATEDDRLDAWRRLGLTYILLGESRDAQRAFTTLLALAQKRRDITGEWRAEEGLGRTALKAHDPQTAITHLQRAVEIAEQSPGSGADAPYEFLVAALMMQSASPDDAYVERAFNAAAHRTRAEVGSTLENGQAYVQYLVGDEHAYGWLLTRERMTGFELPPPADLEADVAAAAQYAQDRDRDGLDRISEDFAPAVLGPVIHALPSLSKIMIVPDGVLQRLPFGALRIDDRYLAERVAVSVADSNGRQVEARPPEDGRGALQPARMMLIALAAALLAGLAFFSLRARRRSRARS